MSFWSMSKTGNIFTLSPERRQTKRIMETSKMIWFWCCDGRTHSGHSVFSALSEDHDPLPVLIDFGQRLNPPRDLSDVFCLQEHEQYDYTLLRAYYRSSSSRNDHFFFRVQCELTSKPCSLANVAASCKTNIKRSMTMRRYMERKSNPIKLFSDWWFHLNPIKSTVSYFICKTGL